MPNHKARYNDDLLREELELAEYRRGLVKEFHSKRADKEKKFPMLMDMPGLAKKYNEYITNMSGVFYQFAMDMPTGSSIVAAEGRQGRKTELLEKHYVKVFKHILDLLSKSPPPGLPQAHSKSPYHYTDCQNKTLELTKLKPNFIFCPHPWVASYMRDAHTLLEAKQSMTKICVQPS
ncbi:hypothetical protein GGI06_000193 [Coemansia sp. S85]|nr:hypothetical protein GGI06_000193 [Coemansia sp. S85]